MFSSLIRGLRGKSSRPRSIYSRPTLYEDQFDSNEQGSSRPLIPRGFSSEDEDSGIEDEDGDNDGNIIDGDPLLPIFSAAHLGES